MSVHISPFAFMMVMIMMSLIRLGMIRMIRMMSSGRVVSHGMTQGRGMMMHGSRACSDIPCSHDDEDDEDLYGNVDDGGPKACSDILC